MFTLFKKLFIQDKSNNQTQTESVLEHRAYLGMCGSGKIMTAKKDIEGCTHLYIAESYKDDMTLQNILDYNLDPFVYRNQWYKSLYHVEMYTEVLKEILMLLLNRNIDVIELKQLCVAHNSLLKIVRILDIENKISQSFYALLADMKNKPLLNAELNQSYRYSVDMFMSKRTAQESIEDSVLSYLVLMTYSMLKENTVVIIEDSGIKLDMLEYLRDSVYFWVVTQRKENVPSWVNKYKIFRSLSELEAIGELFSQDKMNRSKDQFIKSIKELNIGKYLIVNKLGR